MFPPRLAASCLAENWKILRWLSILVITYSHSDIAFQYLIKENREFQQFLSLRLGWALISTYAKWIVFIVTRESLRCTCNQSLGYWLQKETLGYLRKFSILSSISSRKLRFWFWNIRNCTMNSVQCVSTYLSISVQFIILFYMLD